MHTCICNETYDYADQVFCYNYTGDSKDSSDIDVLSRLLGVAKEVFRDYNAQRAFRDSWIAPGDA